MHGQENIKKVQYLATKLHGVTSQKTGP